MSVPTFAIVSRSGTLCEAPTSSSIAANVNGTLSIADPRWDFEINSVGTFNVVEAALAAGTQRLVYVSSASAYGVPQRCPIAEEHPLRPFLPYGASKLAES